MGTIPDDIRRILDEDAEIGRRQAALQAQLKRVNEQIEQGDRSEAVFRENSMLHERISELVRRLQELRQL